MYKNQHSLDVLIHKINLKESLTYQNKPLFVMYPFCTPPFDSGLSSPVSCKVIFPIRLHVLKYLNLKKLFKFQQSFYKSVLIS